MTRIDARHHQGITPTRVGVAWWRAHPGIDKAHAELAKLVARQ